MKITYKDYEEDIDAINNSKTSPISRYSIDIDGEQKKPGAMSVLDILDKETTFEERAEFVKTLLLGCRVTVYEDGKKLFEIGVTPGMQWWAVKEFEEYFNDITEFWFYQYTEAFHCKPDTIEDMLMGIKYLYFKTEDR